LQVLQPGADFPSFDDRGMGRCRRSQASANEISREPGPLEVLGDFVEVSDVELRQMRNRGRQTGFIGKSLLLHLPQAHPGTVAATAISGDQ
jgi:hypothetical protein